ncbi:hypothetical protein K470DRAFT_203880, partial [Piedraia hortae CBS 480.64]
VHLHPLVLLVISDYITRHTLRRQDGPIVGAVMGQLDSRIYTLEHAFECKPLDGQLDRQWFSERVEQHKRVFESLDAVAMFVCAPSLTAAHHDLLQQAHEALGSHVPLLLIFHADQVNELKEGKLPISIFEKADAKLVQVPYEIETGEAEMIAVDSVAKGGGNATAVLPRSTERSKSKSVKSDLSAEDEDVLAALTTKVNAVRMLDNRVRLIRNHLTSLPESYLTDATSSDFPPSDANHVLLRNIQSLISRLHILNTLDGCASAEEDRQDVLLDSLLTTITRSVAEAQGMAVSLSAVQKER